MTIGVKGFGMGAIRVGVGGWSFAPWRETFYPASVKRADELAYASRALTSIEINGTFYRTQTPSVFRSWRAAAPDGFVFAVKAPRAATYVGDVGRAGQAVERFLGSGVTELGDGLGPILWQFAGTRKFDEAGFGAFLDLLPAERDGVRLRHVIEMRHATASAPRFAGMLAERGVALALIERPGETMREELTADFAYLRLESSVDEERAGYPEAAISEWAERLKGMALEREVFAYVISGAKHRNPAAAQALIGALQQ